MSDKSDHSSKQSASSYRIPAGSGFHQAWKMAAVVGAIGLAIGAFGYTIDPRRFAFSYLMGFFSVLTMALGSIFFVLIQHLTGAGWSVTVRRTSEFLAAGIIVVPLLALPNLLGREQLYPWWNQSGEGVAHAQEHAPPAAVRVRTAAVEQHGEAAEAEGEAGPEQAIEERVIQGKLPYLNQGSSTCAP